MKLTIKKTVTDDGGGDPKATTTISNQNRQDWNDYVDWLDKKGLKGSPALDHNDLGGQMIDQYRKENPNTTVSRDLVIPLQKDFSNYRNYALDKVNTGQALLAPGTTPTSFLSALSIVDGIPGQRTTSYKFPSAYMTDMDSGKTTNKGFATTNQTPTQLLTSK